MSPASRVPGFFSLDDLLLLVLTLPYFLQFKDPVLFLVILLLAAYLMVSRVLGSSRGHFLKLTVILLVVVLTTLMPLLGGIGFRLQTEGTTNEFVTSGSMHDGALQTEEAVRLFLAGKNPYTADYSDTLVAQYPIDLVAVNPALTHYVYLPLNFLLSIPFYWLFNSLLGWYDQRLVYGLGFILVLLLVPSQTRSRENRILLWTLLGLNPLLSGRVDVGVATGANDYLVLSLVMLSVVLMAKGNLVLSAIPLALASATKPSAWFFLPFYFALFLYREPLTAGLRAAVRAGLALITLSVAILLPFFLWDPTAFVEDSWSYATGGSAAAYPIRGLGISTILLETGVIPSRAANFPFWILELSFGGVVLFLLLRRQLQENTVRQAWLGYGFFLGTTAFFSRFLNPNYLGYILAVLALGLWSDPSPLSGEKPSPEAREYEA